MDKSDSYVCPILRFSNSTWLVVTEETPLIVGGPYFAIMFNAKNMIQMDQLLFFFCHIPLAYT